MSVVVGTGVVIVNSKGEVLLGKRSGKHAPYWSIFGDMLILVKPLKPALSVKFRKRSALPLLTRRLSVCAITWKHTGRKASTRYQSACWHTMTAIRCR